ASAIRTAPATKKARRTSHARNFATRFTTISFPKKDRPDPTAVAERNERQTALWAPSGPQASGDQEGITRNLSRRPSLPHAIRATSQTIQLTGILSASFVGLPVIAELVVARRRDGGP